MKKSFFALVFVGVLLISLVSALAVAPIIEEVHYDGNGKVDVDFVGHVRYNNPTIVLKDAEGNSYDAQIIDKDDDDLEFVAYNLAANREYTFNISGVSDGGSADFATIEGAFNVGSGLYFLEIDSDAEENEVEVEFSKYVEYNNPTVIVETQTGEQLNVKVHEFDRDSLELRVKGLRAGEEYRITVSGVRIMGDTNEFAEVTGTFIARND